MTAPDDEALAALLALVRQIVGGGYRDHHGHPLETNEAFLDAIALLTLHGAATNAKRPPPQ